MQIDLEMRFGLFGSTEDRAQKGHRTMAGLSVLIAAGLIGCVYLIAYLKMRSVSDWTRR
ncbi:MAG: hypothetical protein ACLQG3_18185 [Terracidiphilus sp.]